VTKIDANGIQITSGPLSAGLKAEVARLSPETTARHEPGMLSMCKGSGGFTFMLFVDASREGKCTAFGRIGSGAQVVRAMSGAPVDAQGKPATPITITKAELYASVSEAVSKLRASK
jgi:cyclophilin family peptidyl-prolyl cis-trans isomerase